jgi:hypothetical protein
MTLSSAEARGARLVTSDSQDRIIAAGFAIGPLGLSGLFSHTKARNRRQNYHSCAAVAGGYLHRRELHLWRLSRGIS